MSLRTKNVLVVGAILAALLVVVSVASSRLFLQNVEGIETRSVSADVARVTSALASNADHLNTLAIDWAQWDDTVAFVQNHNADYIATNLDDSTLARLGINLILFYDAQQKYVHGKAIDLKTGRAAPMPTDLLDALAQQQMLLNPGSQGHALEGILLLPETTLLLAAQPVLTSEGIGPSRGAVIIGQYLDETEFVRLGRLGLAAVAGRAYDDPGLPADYVRARAAMASGSSLQYIPDTFVPARSGVASQATAARAVYVEPESQDVVAGFTVLTDVAGQPALLLRVANGRDIYHQGETAQRFLNLVVLLVGLTFGVAIMLALETTVLAPVSRLSRDVGRIGAGGDPTARVAVVGQDELGNLAVSINGMLEALTRAQHERQESQERYATVIDQAWDGLFISEWTTLRLLEANRALLELTGYSLEELQQLTAFDLIADDPAKVFGNSERLRRDGRANFGERRYRHKDGSLIDVESSGCLIYSGDRDLACVLIHDISQRKAAEQDLLEEKRFSDAVIASLPGMFLLLDSDGHFVRWNRNVELATGYDAEDLRRLNDLESVIAEESRTSVLAAVKRALAEGSASEDALVLSKSGERLPYHLTAVRAVIGGSTYLLSTGTNISELVEARNAWQHYAERVTVLHEIDQATLASQSLESIADLTLRRIHGLVPFWMACVIVLDDDKGEETTVLAGYGDGWERLPAGTHFPRPDVSREQMQQGHIFAVDDIEVALRRSPLLDGLLAAGLRSYVDVPFMAGGELMGVLALGSSSRGPLPASQVAIACEVASQLAIAVQQARLKRAVQRHTTELEGRVETRTAELREAAARVQAANEQLKTLDRMKSQFVSNVSHELRTPLSNVKLYLSLLEEGRPERRGQYMATLNREAELLQRLIEDLLQLSRLDLGKTRPELAQVDLNTLLVTLAHDRSALFAERGLALRVDVEPRLPLADVDPKMMTQVLTNLMTNAMNYTPAGGRITVRTRCRQEADGPWVALTVADTGIGISEADRAHLFERFFRGQAAAQNRVPGTGLGLAICHEIVQLHGGHITVEAEAGGGSAFTVWLRCGT